MARSGEVLQDNEGYLWRQTGRAIRELQKRTAFDVPTGAVITMVGPLRSPIWSQSRALSIGTNSTKRYQLNELDGNAQEVGFDPADDGIYKPLADTSMQPIPGQPGGLSSEGDYSVYFPALTSIPASTIKAPLALTTQRAWSMEAIFRTDGLPQLAGFIAFNGTLGTNGYGIMVGDPAGITGSKLLLRLTAVGYLDPGITLIDKQWYHAIFVADDSDNTLKWYVGTLNAITRAFTYSSGSIAMATPPVTPTGSSYIGGQSDGVSPYNVFKGWVSEVCFFQGKIPSGAAKLSAQDRIRAGLEPAPPNGWLKCDGSAVSRTEFGPLFRRIGTVAGTGDGSTTFTLPNIVGGIIKV